MKVFALGLFAKPLTHEQRKRILRKEVPDTLRLYLDGKIDQFWFREDKSLFHMPHAARLTLRLR